MKSADQHSFIASGTTRGAGHLIGKRLLPFRLFVQFQAAINAIDPFVVPAVTLATQPLEQLAKSLLRSLSGQLQEQLHDWSIGVGRGS
jgi:hypothetical protein